MLIIYMQYSFIMHWTKLLFFLFYCWNYNCGLSTSHTHNFSVLITWIITTCSWNYSVPPTTSNQITPLVNNISCLYLSTAILYFALDFFNFHLILSWINHTCYSIALAVLLTLSPISNCTTSNCLFDLVVNKSHFVL